MVNKRLHSTSLVLLVLGIILLNEPIIRIFNIQLLVKSIPLLYIYLFALWMGIVIGSFVIFDFRNRNPK